jgi:hypothetical protein
METDRWPELAARLKGLDAAVREADARVAEARRAVEALLEEVRAVRAALPRAVQVPEPAPAPRRNDPHALDQARLVAIDMADAGATRAEVERHLRASFSLGDTGALLDDVFGEGPEPRRASSL